MDFFYFRQFIFGVARGVILHYQAHQFNSIRCLRCFFFFLFFRNAPVQAKQSGLPSSLDHCFLIYATFFSTVRRLDHQHFLIVFNCHTFRDLPEFSQRLVATQKILICATDDATRPIGSFFSISSHFEMRTIEHKYGEKKTNTLEHTPHTHNLRPRDRCRTKQHQNFIFTNFIQKRRRAVRTIHRATMNVD